MSLTAIGLLWNIADYLKRERDNVLAALYVCVFCPVGVANQRLHSGA